MLYPISDLSNVSMGIRLKNSDDTDQVWARFHEEYDYRGFGTLYAFYKKIFQVIYEITGGLLLVFAIFGIIVTMIITCLLYTSPSPRDATLSRMPSSA